LKKCRKWEWITLSDNKMMLLAIVPMLQPAFIYYELKCIHPFTHDFLFLVLSLYTCLSVLKEKNTSLIEKGLVLGLCILARGTFIVFPLIVLTLICFKKEIKKVTLIAIGMGIMLSPWLIHNYLSDGIIGLTSTSGKILWKGSLHDSEGGNYLNNGENYYSALSAKDLNDLGKSSVKEQNDFFMHRYKAQWKNEPLHVLKMLAIKMKNFWFYSPNMGKEYPSFVQKAVPTLRLINLIFIAVLLFLSLKNRHFMWIFIAVAFSLLQCFFYFEARHRIITEPLLIIIFMHLYYTYFKKKTIA
jgi:4-amino-4-deoxy-L-arabinose transferase-like glycosyltransferase